MGISTILWITLTQLAAAGVGGYLAGRLRTKWASAQADEVYFRDTAHGFLTWSVATIVTAAMLSSAIGSIVGAGLQAGSAVAAGAGTALTGAATAAAGGASMGRTAGMSDAGSGYFIDSLFRKDAAQAAAAAPAAAGTEGQPATGAAAGTTSGARTNPAEVGRIFMNSLGTGALPPDDLHYVGQVVARDTGLSQADAEKRVGDTYARMQAKARDAETAARDAADKARKGSAYTALWLFVSLLIGAFVASWAATFGGRQRDL